MDSELTRAWLLNAALLIEREKDRLTQLDLAIGDGDHGVNMQRGFSAVAAGLAEPPPAGTTAGQLLVTAGTTLVSTVGGASGPLFGGAFRALGKTLDTAAEPDDTRLLADGLNAARDSIQRMGAAQPGDKTMYDVYGPAAEAFGHALCDGAGPRAAARAAAEAADEGVRATEPMQARRGRASYLGLRSVGHQDPGAASAALIFQALATAMEAQ
ncbi:dihydroxyacetone kinase subunit L [Streptomyces sp. XM83C]|uniref:Dihydroxyacetone kinase subunit DhaL n=1 Tax=Streptomyces thermocoprophilus TaxID=78356 RepID=A0ABV5VCV5_9ACTN|nr:dihydroxyacetone kinase subunit DhaL [Streptomyces sp. XM83C]MCK1822497.1 dihydroxyacetone kinase subunit L [Streptomyces sp. XM83C]